VYDGATLIGSTAVNGTGAWSFTTAVLANGGHSLTATASDAAGNTGVASSALSVTIDTMAPIAPSIGSGVIVNSNQVALVGTAEANSTVKIYEGATLLGNATANASGAWGFTTAALVNGGHNLTATATDAAGNTGLTSSALNVTIDTTTIIGPPPPPAITAFSTDSGAARDRLTNDNTPTLSGTAVANSTVNVYDGATLLGSTTANASGAWSFTTGALTDGNHNLSATDTDAFGNTSVASTALALTIDTKAPASPTAYTSLGTGSFAYLSGTAEAGSTVSVLSGVDGSLVGSAFAGATGTWTFMKFGPTPTTFKLTATDAAGNTSPAPQGPALANAGAPDAGNTSDMFVFSATANATHDHNVAQLNQDLSATVDGIESNLAAIAAHAVPGEVEVIFNADALNILLSHFALNNSHLV
jgi:large repetitive protein